MADVRFNGPITLTDSEPEPDIAIVRLPESLYDDRHPGPEDILWIVEVARSSLKQDLETEPEIYATAGIREYWILDLSSKRVLVLRNPRGNEYLEKLEITDGAIAPLAFASIEISVKRLLP